MKKVKINFKEYMYQCGDGCCTEYGTITTVNGKELDLNNEDTETIVEMILKELGYEAEITREYDN
jgi:hypothetical protein